MRIQFLLFLRFETCYFWMQVWYFILLFGLLFWVLFLHEADGRWIVVGIMGTMDFFTADKEKERLLAQPIHLMIELEVVSIMLHRSSFSRKTVDCFVLCVCSQEKIDAWSFDFGCMIFHLILTYFALRVCLSKNGTVVGAVPKDMKGPLYPTIAVHSQNEEYVISSLNIKL